ALSHVRSRLTLLFFLSRPAPPALSPLSLHDALPIFALTGECSIGDAGVADKHVDPAVSARGGLHQRAHVLLDSDVAPLKDRLPRSEEHTSELQSRGHLVCRLLLEKKKKYT